MPTSRGGFPQVRYTYDGAGRRVSEILPTGTIGDPGPDAVTLYTYDGAGNLLSESNPADPAAVTRYEYDGKNNLVAVHEPVGGLAGGVAFGTATTTYTYTAAGHLLSETDPRGQFGPCASGTVTPNARPTSDNAA